MTSRNTGQTLSGFVAADGRKLFFGKYRAIVLDANDPLKMGRIKAICPELSEAVTLRWAIPVFPYGAGVQSWSENKPARGQGFGFGWVPEVGSGVFLEFEGGDINRPLWVGSFFSVPGDPGGQEEAPGFSKTPNSPEEFTNSTDPDTDEPDYPTEKVLKTERFSGIGTRLITWELDADTKDTPVWDVSWVGKTKYQKPKITLGRRGTTDQGGKNVVDISMESRDLVIREDRDRNTIVKRDIHEEAGRNCSTFAGKNHGLGNSPEGWGYILEEADTAIEMYAAGTPGGTYASRDRLIGDCPHARVRFSSGLNPIADATNPKEASADAADLTIKLTGEQYVLLRAALLDIVMRSGVDTYARTGNGFVVETFSGNVASPRASQLHYRGPSAPSVGGPANESGRPAPYAPEGVGSRTFNRSVDERAIFPYNHHYHDVLVPDPVIDDPGGGEGDPDDIGVGDWLETYSVSMDYSNVGFPEYDTVFQNGFYGQMENVTGTTGSLITDESGTFGALDMLASAVQSLTEIVLYLTSSSSLGAALVSIGVTPQAIKYDDWAPSQAADFTGAGGSFSDPVVVSGPKLSAAGIPGIPMLVQILDNLGPVPSPLALHAGTNPVRMGIPRNHKSSAVQTAEDIFGKPLRVNLTGSAYSGSSPQDPLTLQAIQKDDFTGGFSDSPELGGYKGLMSGLPSTEWKCGSITPTPGFSLTVTSTPCPPHLWQVQDPTQPALVGAATASFEGQTAVRVSTEYARAN